MAQTSHNLIQQKGSPKSIPLKQCKFDFGYSVLLAHQRKEEYHDFCIYFSDPFATIFRVIFALTNHFAKLVSDYLRMTYPSYWILLFKLKVL